MNIKITPTLLEGSITPPPSKSQAHRLLIAAALSGGVSIVSNLADSQDIQATRRYPAEVRQRMGNRLIGCDTCQRCCPHHPPPEGETHPIPVPLEDILNSPKQSAIRLRDHIGATITMFNRVLGGACIVAGCTGRVDLLPRLEELTESPSEAVATHARWAVEQIRMKHL